MFVPVQSFIALYSLCVQDGKILQVRSILDEELDHCIALKIDEFYASSPDQTNVQM
jgi:hypothetical protein